MIVYGLLRAGLNIAFDYILIYGKLGFPALGIKGAAIGTTIAEYLGAIFIARGVVARDRKNATANTAHKISYIVILLFFLLQDRLP